MVRPVEVCRHDWTLYLRSNFEEFMQSVLSVDEKKFFVRELWI